MNARRYEDLLGRLFEEELSEADAEELARELSANPALRQDLRRHLVLWELWSQQQAPERSPEAFVNAWKTRLRAEREAEDVFPGAVRALLETRRCQSGIIETVKQFVSVRRPIRLAWAASLLMGALALVCWTGIQRSAVAVTTLVGEAVCTACVLHESHEHAPAVRVIAGGSTNIYYLDRNPAVAGLQDYFCAGPTGLAAKGSARIEAGQRRFAPGTVTIPAANTAPTNTTNALHGILPI